MKQYWAVIGTKSGKKTLCGAYEVSDDAKVRWWDIKYVFKYEEVEIIQLQENKISMYENVEVRFPNSSFLHIDM